MRGTPRVAIIGAGFGGLAAAIELRRAGIDSFEIFERGERVGGVWRENTYPGCGCDIPSPLYSFSYEPNPRWPRRYSDQASILAYLERCAQRYGMRDRIRLRSEVQAASFDEARNRWALTVGGEQREFDVLVCACGQLSEPALPDLPGREAFAGHSFHSARWDHDCDLRGKRVAVIGTGASAIQFVPEIAPLAARLHLFQRSPPWIMPKPDRRYSALHHRLFERFPALLGAERLGWYLFCEYAQSSIGEHPRGLAPWAQLARWNLRRHVADPLKRAALEPDYAPGCKRILFSDDFYPAVARENVELIPDGAAALTAAGVVSRTGTTREVDVVIYGTGFQAHGFVAPMRITGRGGRRLQEDAWAAGATAYLGLTVPGFPNMFLQYGPNTNLGGGSIVHMLESSARYLADAVRQLARRPGAAFDVRAQRLAAWDAEIQRRLADSAWASGCHSWYIDEHGRNANNWPGTMAEYRRRTRCFDPGDYELLPEPVSATVPAHAG